MPTYGNELVVTINLEGTADVVNNRYFMIFSTNEATIPLPPPDSLDEFLEPGDEPQPGGKTKAQYYSSYYSTWSGYVVVDSLGYFMEKGPFDINTASTREVISGLGTVTNTLTFKIRLERIFGNTLPSKIYMDIITVSYPINSMKVLADRITPPARCFEPIKGTTITMADTDPSSVASPSLNIRNWEITLP